MAHRIDIEGTILLTAGVGPITLGLTWGGTQYPWASGTIIGLFAFGAVMMATMRGTAVSSFMSGVQRGESARII